MGILVTPFFRLIETVSGISADTPYLRAGRTSAPHPTVPPGSLPQLPGSPFLEARAGGAAPAHSAPHPAGSAWLATPQKNIPRGAARAPCRWVAALTLGNLRVPSHPVRGRLFVPAVAAGCSRIAPCGAWEAGMGVSPPGPALQRARTAGHPRAPRPLRAGQAGELGSAETPRRAGSVCPSGVWGGRRPGGRATAAAKGTN